MAASQNGWGRNGWGVTLRVAKILHRAGIATALALLTVVVVASGDALAQSTAVYTVRDVPVDATAENAARAREAAIAQGQQQALRQLLERLTPPEPHGQLPSPSASEVEQMVLGLSLADEKTSSVRYLAKLTVRFMPQAVQGLLQQGNLPYVDEPAPPLIVLPVWQPAPESPPVLWEDPNPWRRAWGSLPRGGLQPLETPLGDLEDVMAIDAARAASADPAALTGMAERYGADGVLVARAVQHPGTPEQPARVEVSAARDGETLTTSVEMRPDADPMDALRRAAQDIRGQLEAAWKAERAGTLASGPAQRLTVLVPIGSLHDWLTVRQALDDTPAVSAWTLQALTKDRAQVSLAVRGTPANLSEALAPHGLRIVQDAGYWVIERGPARPALPQPQVQQPPAQPATPQQGGAPVSYTVGSGVTAPR